MDMKNVKLAEFLNDWLTKEERSVRWLARKAKVSHTVVTDMTNGHVPKLDYLIAVEKAMGLEPGELIDLAAQIERGGMEPRLLSVFSRGWRKFPPDLQRDLTDFVTNATPEESARVFRDVIRTWLLNRDVSDTDDADADAESDEEPPAPEKGVGQQQARLQPDGGTA